MKRRLILALATAATALSLGCSTLDEQQRAWIFQPSDRAWGGSASQAEGMEDVWIEFDSRISGGSVKLHGLWLEAETAASEGEIAQAQALDVAASETQPAQALADDPVPSAPASQAPVLLYLHGAKWNVAGSAGRIRRMHEMGFSVLAIDYRGFGKSTAMLPSEDMAYEDAQAAWKWLASKYPDRPRYVFGHSLGGAIAIDLAARVEDERGTIVEGTFTSIPDVASTFKWGWLPVGPLITQRFESINKVARIGSPLLVVHGAADNLIKSDLGRRLYEAATGKKKFLLVEGGSHHSTMWVGQAKYREAMAQLFSLAP